MGKTFFHKLTNVINEFCKKALVLLLEQGTYVGRLNKHELGLYTMYMFIVTIVFYIVNSLGEMLGLGLLTSKFESTPKMIVIGIELVLVIITNKCNIHKTKKANYKDKYEINKPLTDIPSNIELDNDGIDYMGEPVTDFEKKDTKENFNMPNVKLNVNVEKIQSQKQNVEDIQINDTVVEVEVPDVELNNEFNMEENTDLDNVDDELNIIETEDTNKDNANTNMSFLDLNFNVDKDVNVDKNVSVANSDESNTVFNQDMHSLNVVLNKYMNKP